VKKRSVLVIAALTMMLVIGCQGKQKAAEGSTDKPYAGTNLTFLRHSGYDAEWMAEKAVSFYEETGIKVTIEQVAFSEVHNKFVLDASSPSGQYDLFASTDYWLPEFYEGGWIIDLNLFLNNSSLLKSDFNLPDVSQNIRDVDSIDGKLLAFPWKFNSEFLYYRTDLLNKAPETWDEFLDAAKKTNSGSTVGIALPLAKSIAMDTYLNLLYQNGGTLLSSDLKKCNLDSPEALAAMQFLIELSKYSHGGMLSSHWEEVVAVFSQGNAAMAFMINTQAGNISDPAKSQVTDKIAATVMPGKKTSAAAASTWGICITKNCKNPEAAFLYIQYLNRPDHIRELVKATNGSTIPVRSSILTDGEFAKAYAHFSVMNKIASTPGYTYSYPKTPKSTAIMEILASYVQTAVLGSDSAQGALLKAKADIEKLL
jgi:multiple sugar transport system substrate-binding protein